MHSQCRQVSTKVREIAMDVCCTLNVQIKLSIGGLLAPLTPFVGDERESREAFAGLLITLLKFVYKFSLIGKGSLAYRYTLTP